MVQQIRLVLVLTSLCVAVMALNALLTLMLPTPVDASSLSDGPGTVAIRLEDELPSTLPNGVAAGDVNQDQVVLWARSTMTGELIITLPDGSAVSQWVEDTSVPNKITATGLTANTPYTYSVRNAAGVSVTGRFRTPAVIGEHVGLRFGVSGDWRGDLGPFVAVKNGPERDLDFFVALGDTVYADVSSPGVPDGPARSLADYRLKHAEVYTSQHGSNVLANLRADTILYGVIDDHEIVNNFAGGAGADTDGRFDETTGFINDTERFEAGLQAFEEYYPVGVEEYGTIGGDGRMDGEHKLYRYRTFGGDAAIFLLDARSFRDAPNDEPRDVADLPRYYSEIWTPGRTLLGEQQLLDLKEDLLDAQAKEITWKFVIIPEPIQIIGPIGASDRFEGYTAERAQILRFIHEEQLSNVVFIAADVHGTVVNNVSYRNEQSAPTIALNAFEVTTGPVAQPATFGSKVVTAATDLGWISAAELAVYAALPVAPDMDDIPDDKDDFVKAILDGAHSLTGEDAVGLGGSSIDATLVVGDYIVAHTYGWTEFEIDGDTQELTVTTYGIPAYSAADLAVDPGAIVALTPEIVAQFRVRPDLASDPTFDHRSFLPAALK